MDDDVVFTELSNMKFIMDDNVYNSAEELLEQLTKTNIIHPQLKLHDDCLCLEWSTCEVHIFESNALLCTDTCKNSFDIPNDTCKLLEKLCTIVPFKRSKPINIPPKPLRHSTVRKLNLEYSC